MPEQNNNNTSTNPYPDTQVSKANTFNVKLPDTSGSNSGNNNETSD